MHKFPLRIKVILCAAMFIFLNVFPISQVKADNADGFILIISSYNPETSQTSRNISAFLEEYRQLGGDLSVIIENMNCKSFSEAALWKEKMENILLKYSNENSPSLVILLGQEAWSAYLSLDKQLTCSIPAICGMVSRNALILPGDTVDLKNWEPASIDAFEDVEGRNVVAGYSYEYDIKKNVELIKKLYPQTENIAFISDNTYGGVSMQALVRDEMKDFPELNLILLDGRKYSIYTMVEEIAALPERTVLLIGTWRVDMNEGYFMNNATYTMKDANPKLPAFTVSSLGLGYWTIGGYIPRYKTVGGDMARQAFYYLHKDKANKVKIEIVPGQYIFDAEKLAACHISMNDIPSGAELVNVHTTFFEEYKYHILGVVLAFCVLLAAFLISMFYYFKTKKLKDDLLESEANLRVAKDRAEESSRLKTAFLANMSHEIRTPLNAIVGFSNVLAAGGSSEEEQQRYFEIIQNNSDMLLHLINDILDISRLESGRIKFVYEDCDIAGLCRTAVTTIEFSRRTTAKFVFNATCESVILRTDVQRLQQVLINLLSNAGKFTPDGTVTLDFEIDQDKQMVVFSVTDTGCGIPLDKQNLVFERFEKLNEYAQGTGLGLAICKLIVNKFGGEIWVDSAYTDGARFMFSHPLDIVEQED